MTNFNFCMSSIETLARKTVEFALNQSDRIEQRCPNVQPSVEILEMIYMLVANVLLLNLLIALFSSTYSRIEAMAVQYYKFGQYHLVREYFYKPVLPPPLIVFSWFHYFQMWIYAIYKHGWSNVNMSEQFHRQIDKLRRPRHSMRRCFLPAVELHNKLKDVGKEINMSF